MIRMKKILSLVLAFALFASVCTNGSMPVFAVGSEPTLTAVPAGVTPTEESLGTQIAYVANDTVTVYEYYENGALGMVCTGALGEQLELTKKFTYTVEGVDTVIYHFADSDFTGAMGAADNANYQFILASDVTFTAPEVTPAPELIEETVAVKNFITDHGVVTSKDYYDTGKEPTATIKNNPVVVYDGFEDGAKYLDLADVSSATISLGQKIVYSDTTVLYRFSCDSTNTVLHDAYSDGYFFILEKDVDVAASGGSTTTPDTTPTIPENPTLTEGVDVSIVDGTGAPVTDAGLKVREGAKISLSAWTGLTDIGDETYQWQITSEETAGYWVNINGQKSKGLLMSLAMVNSMTVPSIRCKIVTGGATKYSMAIPVTALKEDTFTDDSSSVSVAGVLPIDATLTVSNTSVAATGLNNGVYPVGDVSLFNDVTLYRGGSTYQPEDGETVTVTFPESSVTSTGFAAGDAYHVYHIHDGVVDLSEIKYYNGGNVEMEFSNLSVVGISEATAAEKDLVEQHGAITNQESISQILYIMNDSVVLYDNPESTGEATAYMTTITGCAGAEVEAWQKVTYEDGFVVYVVRDTGNTPIDLFSTLRQYPVISADDVSEETADEPVVINICAICGKEMGTECVTPHVYCTECKTFDCGETHEQPATEKPVTAPVIPANPTLTSDADVTIVDEKGNPVTDTFTLYEGTRESLSAWDDLDDTNDVSFQWQIRYDAANDLWVNIQCQTGKGIVISPAMFAGMQGSAYIRCVMNGTLTSDAISVSIEEQPEQPAVTSFNLLSNARNGIAIVADEGDTGAGTLTNYNVVINYVFENNEIVATPYTATLAAGSDFSATVTFPTVMGYLPYLGNATESTTSLALNITDIQADVTYTVTYKPTNVNYTVIHYQQNVDNDNFTIVETETKQGPTNSQVPEVAKDYPGFYALLYVRPTIAADGSTTVEVYYDRVYYLMNFELDGGYGVEPIYDRYEAPITVDIPAKAGYTFLGWKLNGEGDTIAAADMPTIMPAEKRKYVAQWQAVDLAKVSIEIWGENADDEGYSYIKTGEFYAKPGETISFAGGNIACGYEEHTHSSACYDCGNAEHTHSADCCTVIEHTHSAVCCTTAAHTHDAACCTVVGHNHTTACYENVGSASYAGLNAPASPVNGTIARKAFSFDGGKVIYINGNWYEYTGSVAVGSVATATCGETVHDHTSGCVYCTEPEHSHGDGNCTYCSEAEHTHGDGKCVYCNTAEHAHDEECFTCTKTEHSHSSNCYMTDPGMNSALWVLKSSDTVTVAADGSTVMKVYYDRTTFTLTFRANGNTVATITDKWGALISDEFEKAPFNTTYNGRAWKCTDTNKYGYALQTLDRMPQFDATFNLYDQSSYTLKTIYYYLENVGANVSHTTWPTNTNNFTLLKEVDTYFNFATYEEEYHEIEGFTRYDKTVSGFGNDEEKNFSNNEMYLYYLRNSYQLDFHDGYNVTASATVEYQAPLSTYDSYVPEVPEAYEEGSVVFGGWYLSPDCSGDEYVLDEYTMPLGNLILYAKWVPVTHTVKIYLTEEDAIAGTNQLGTTQTVEHRATATAPEESLIVHPDSVKYDFVVWQYKDENGNVKQFDFSMPVTQDLVLFPKWSSNVLMEYIVYFKIQDTDIEIAKPISSSTLAGETETFDAKGGTDLYDPEGDINYQEGYFPLVKSHSITLDINTPATPGQGENGEEWVEITNADGTKKIVQSFTFWYVQKDAVPYTVYYVAETLKEGGTSLGTVERDDKTYYIIAETYTNSENRKAVVTEKFKQVSGYMPDAYQKRLVVDGTEDAVNEIIFYYSVDSTHAYYKITHYTQNTDGASWTEYASSQAPGEINNTVLNSDDFDINIDGFTYKPDLTGKVVGNEEEVVIGNTDVTLTADGLELKLYYVRNSYPYEVRYLEQGTGKQLANPKPGTGLYGAVVFESAIEITGYEAVAPTSQTLTIKIEESQTQAELNIITFYYTEQEVTINYEVVGPEGCGTVDPTSETLKVFTGNAKGSTAAPAKNYRFVGWYSDAKCINEVGTKVNYVPTKKEAAWKSTTYYAKFELAVADLTITKSIKSGNISNYDEGQSFIFRVTGLNGFSLDVVINGTGSVTIKDLPIGTYTVTEITDWSWRYTPDSKDKSITLDDGENKVEFTNNRSLIYWLSGDSYNENHFKPTAQ